MTYEIRPRIRRLFHLDIRRPDIAHADLDAELAFHVEARAQQLAARGLSAEDARYEALRKLGISNPPTRAQLHSSVERKERRMARREWFHDLTQDIKYAYRGLLRRPGFAAIAVVTLAIGIGANTAIFSAVNALLLRSLPFPAPEQLMEISLVPPAEGAPHGRPAPRGPDSAERLTPWSFRKFTLYRDQQRSFASTALWADQAVNITDGDAERADAEHVTARYLATLGLAPQAGSDFPVEIDAHGGAPAIVLISEGLWQRRFNRDPAAVGQTIAIDGTAHQVIGIMPREFRGLSGRAELLLPITRQDQAQLDEPWSLQYAQIGRLKRGVTEEQARSEAATVGVRVYEATPMDAGIVRSGSLSAWSATARSLNGTRVSPTVRQSLFVLFGAVGFVLLIACVNLANLLLGRATARRREIGVRLALGARRGRLIRLLLTESVLLALVGGAASVLVAWYGTRALSAANPVAALQAQNIAGLGMVGFDNIRLDASALLFAFGISLAVGVLFGLVPALQSTNPRLQEQIKSGEDIPLSARRFRTVTSRRVLVVAEVALAIVLLAGAGLMIRSLDRLMGVDTGFSADNVLTMRLNVPQQVSRDSLPGFYDELLGRIQALPGVTGAALADCPPLAGGCNGTLIAFPDRPAVAEGEAPSIGVHWVTPGWFRTMGVSLKRGRLFSDADRIGTPKVMLISESAARKYWPGEDPIGKRAAVFQGGFHDGATVIGVVGNVRFGTIDSLPVPDAYISYQQSPRPRMMIFARTANDPEALVALARATVRELLPSYPAYDIQTMESRVAVASTQARLSAILLALFAATALVLAVMGIYGVMSFAVAQRRREIGVRIALGAARGDVLAMVVREGVGLAAIGVTIGLAGALVLSRVLRTLLYGVSSTDPLTYVSVVALLAAAALAASWFPARRATLVQPTEALRGV
jgi:putative ABC transport system permease protein